MALVKILMNAVLLLHQRGAAVGIPLADSKIMINYLFI